MVGKLQSIEALAVRKTVFTQSMIRENALDRRGFDGWVFYKGMLFNARGKWWGDRGKRDNPHEGLDFLLYEDRSGRIMRLEQETRIPVMYDGVVIGIIDDFLGKSVIVTHRLAGSGGRLLLSIYGHTMPAGDVRKGKIVKGADVIGILAHPGKPKSSVCPHLHVSLGWVSKIDVCDNLDWEKLNDPNLITMIDPLEVIDGNYHVLPASH